MIDTAAAIAQSVAGGGGILPIVVSTGAGGGLIGKIIWDWIKQNKHSCIMKDTISEMHEDIAVMKNDIKWIIHKLSQ